MKNSKAEFKQAVEKIIDWSEIDYIDFALSGGEPSAWFNGDLISQLTRALENAWEDWQKGDKSLTWLKCWTVQLLLELSTSKNCLNFT